MNKLQLTGKRTSAGWIDRLFIQFLWIMAILVIILIIWMLGAILWKGLPKINFGFLYELPDEIEVGGGVGPMLLNSFYLTILSLVLSIPIGLGAGIYLAEYAPENKITNAIRMSVESLASVPSIVFGLLGLALFVDYFGIGLTILGGAISLAFLNLPVLTRVTEESVRAVPSQLREASYALGSTKHQTILKVVIPAALSGIVTGICLVAGRALGESAVIILTAGTSTSGAMWDFNLFSPGETLAVHLWYVQSEAIVPDAHEIAEKASALLVLIVLMINTIFRIPLWLMRRSS